jgi:hypothetical protein
MSDWDGWDLNQAIQEGWFIDSDNRIDARSKHFGCRLAFQETYEPARARALAFVQAKAAEGSAYHIDALARTQLL